MPSTWTDTQDREMLLAVVAELTVAVTGEQWAKIAQRLGRGLTGSAVKQHFNKLKNENPGATGKSSGKSSNTSAPKTKTAKTTPAKGAKRGAAEMKDDEAVESQDASAWSDAHEAKKTKIELLDDEGAEEYDF